VLNEATLDFVEADGGLSGFVCHEPITLASGLSPPPLADHALPICQGPGEVTLVFDLIGLAGGSPRCESEDIVSWCTTNDCSTMASARVCTQKDLAGVSPGAPAVAAVSAAIRSLAGSVAAPSQPVIARLVATTQPCSELTDPSAPFECEKLVGCSFSCPTVFGPGVSDVPLELDLGLGAYANATLLDGVCAAGVAVCASNPFAGTADCPALEKSPCPSSLTR
jgi:hypothetical protein